MSLFRFIASSRVESQNSPYCHLCGGSSAQLEKGRGSDVITWNYLELPGINMDYLELPGITWNLPGLPGITWNYLEFMTT